MRSDPVLSEVADWLLCMEVGSAGLVGDACRAVLDEIHAEGSRDWSEDEFERAFGWEIDGLNEAGVDEHARAMVEDASPYGLMARLMDGTSLHAARAQGPGESQGSGAVEGSQGSRQSQGAGSVEGSQGCGRSEVVGRSRCLGDTLDLLRAADRLASWVAARQAGLLAEVFDEVHREERAHSGTVDARFSFTLAAQEIAPLLRVPGRTAHRMLSDALHLTGELPGTWAALDEGRISPVQAQVIVEESGSLPTEAVTGFEETVLETAGGLTRPKLVRRCRRLREELHPETLTVRRVRAVAERRVVLSRSWTVWPGWGRVCRRSRRRGFSTGSMPPRGRCRVRRSRGPCPSSGRMCSPMS